MRLSEIADEVEGSLNGNGSVEISGVATIDGALEGQIAFLGNAREIERLKESGASAFILPEGANCDDRPFITSDNPKLAFAKAVTLFMPQPARKGVDVGFVPGKNAVIGKDVTIYPNVYVGENVEIGNRVTLYPGVFVGDGCRIGDDSVIYANTVVNYGTEIGRRVVIHGGTVIGTDGFGYVWDGKKNFKVPQVGSVVIGDDVEIGANCTVDRAALGVTEIKSGAKIDNLVHIAHNCTVGEDSIIIAQTGLAGSVDVGRNAIISGQVAVTDHVSIGDGAMIGGKSGVTKDVSAGEKVTGYPHMPVSEWLRVQKVSQSLPDMRKQLKTLQNKIEKMENSDD